ncbi:haloalkane dehalogenase [Plantactinospora sp. KBS50]|uniref:haloalkane dehalogenase n=1 Tax=Plantactinospora sp. KBS50 TaxID=2024580 RepID=UPI001E399066|nr:haloalkane dehalogenase [Plantactinospora sp. KBS50]
MPTIDVLDSHIHHTDVPGSRPGGPAIVLLHGNPSSSHAWRAVTPVLSGAGRVLAPDLIGMGRSGKPDIAYSFADHARYLAAWLDAVGLDRVLLVGHDWGGALAFDWAAQHPDRVVGVAFFETIMRPMSWDELGPGPRSRAETMRSAQGEDLILGTNDFISSAYTGGVRTPLSAAEMAPYLAPYQTRESRRPVLSWARSLPLDDDPADVAERVRGYGKWLAASPEVPKLLLTFEGSPTLLVTPAIAAWCAANVAALDIEHIGPAGHHATEDQPAAIGAAVARWVARVVSRPAV